MKDSQVDEVLKRHGGFLKNLSTEKCHCGKKYSPWIVIGRSDSRAKLKGVIRLRAKRVPKGFLSLYKKGIERLRGCFM